MPDWLRRLGDQIAALKPWQAREVAKLIGGLK